MSLFRLKIQYLKCLTGPMADAEENDSCSRPLQHEIPLSEPTNNMLVKEKTVGEFVICPMVFLTLEFIGKPSKPSSGYLLLHHKPPQRVALNNTHLFCLD